MHIVDLLLCCKISCYINFSLLFVQLLFLFQLCFFLCCRHVLLDVFVHAFTFLFIFLCLPFVDWKAMNGYICKQWRPRLNVAKHDISSGTALFVKAKLGLLRKNIYICTITTSYPSIYTILKKTVSIFIKKKINWSKEC